MGTAGNTAALLLDFGGTLDSDGEPWGIRFHRAFLSVGGAMAWETFEPIFRQTDLELTRNPRIATLGFRAMVDLQAKLLLDHIRPRPPLEAQAIADRFAAEVWQRVERNRPLLERWHTKRKLGVISNFTGNLEPCLRELELRSYFEVVLDSSVVGIAKPDLRIFEMALRRLDVPASSAWMVGDNFAADIAPALRVGMRAAWLAPKARALPQDKPAATARLEHLSELDAFLE